jgi:L-lactate dehydrogenase complex protein LldG
MSPREEVLARIRAALADGGEPARPASAGTGPAPDGPDAGNGTGFRTEGDREPGQLLDLLAERLTDYRALVRRTSPAELAATVNSALAERGARRMVVPPGIDPSVLPEGIEIVTDDGLSAPDLDAFDGVITGAAVAVAETGTIVLDGSPDQGRRAITLVPDYHLCIVRAAQVVEIVPEAVARLAAQADRPLTWISGPSATSDIELKRVEGVHGPRTLEVILVGP